MTEEFKEEANDEMNEDLMEDILDDLDEGEGLVDENDSSSMDEPETSDKKKSPGKLSALTGKLINPLKSSKKVLIIVILVAVVLFGLFTGGLWFFLGGDENSGQASQELSQAEHMSPDTMREEEPVFEDIVDLEPFERVFLKSGSAMEMLSVNLSLELMDSRFRKQVYATEDQIRQIITDQIARKKWLELRTPEGKLMLKYELLGQINSIYPKPIARNIYFTYFVMQ